MKINLKLFLAILFTFFIFLLGFFFSWSIYQNKFLELKTDRIEDVSKNISAVIDLKIEPVRSASYDYTFWDELVEFVSSKDQNWARTNLLTAMQTYKMDYIYVISNNGTVVYEAKKSASYGDILGAINLESLNFEEPVFQNYFVDNEDFPVQVFIAPIHNSSDSARTGTPYGYMIVGKTWNKEFLEDLSKINGQKIVLTKNKSLNFDSYYEIKDKNAKEIFYLGIKIDGKRMDLVNEMFFHQMIFFGIMGIVCALILLAITYTIVSRPLRKITLAIKNKDKNQIREFQDKKDEFGRIARLILNFFNQNENLKLQLKRADEAEQERARLQEESYYRLYHSQITSLANRNALLEEISKGDVKALVLFNIDNFQEFNDLFGEEMGNEALKLTAQFLLDNVFEKKLLVYHLGGDEFVYLCKQNEFILLKEFKRKIKTLLEQYKYTKFSYNNNNFSLIMSAGISFSANKPLASANLALQKAKKDHTGVYVFELNSQGEAVYMENILMAQKLLDGLDKGRLICHFQPIIPISDNSLEIKYESLARLSENDGSIIPPFKFLSIAKKVHLYPRLTLEVLKNTLFAIEKYKIHCSFNLSMDDLLNKETYETLFKTFENFKYCNHLTIELLESEAVENYDFISEFTTRARSLGVKIAIDDFGSGYSNFSHILKIKVDYIKIDATLIRDICENPDSKLMTETIVDLAKKLGVKTIAEFVSSQEIFDLLREIGVDYAQGFYIAKPSLVEEAMENMNQIMQI